MDEQKRPPTEPSPPEEQSPVPKGRGISLRELMLVCALLAIVAALLMPSYWRAKERSNVGRVKADLRALATALESYMIDMMSYPACGIAVGPPRVIPPPGGHVIPSPVITLNSGMPMGSGARSTITLRVDHLGHKLTTPIAYLTVFPVDRFADSKGAAMGYFNCDSMGWFAWSVGPDRDENAPGGPGDVGAVVENIYTPFVVQPDMTVLADYTYDPTNGLRSNGDIYRHRQ